MKRGKGSVADQHWHDWNNSIDPERQILLLYKDAVVDMFSASSNIQWNDLVQRLRDLESPLSLFDGHEELQKCVKSKNNIRTIPAIALIAVALNNYAASQNQPFKFCWSHIPLSSAKGDLYMAFGAWSAKEMEDWKSASPGFRAKRCTVWETHEQCGFLILGKELWIFFTTQSLHRILESLRGPKTVFLNTEKFILENFSFYKGTRPMRTEDSA
ncbi:hypothetical protein J3E74DRAFT_404540 [Bipolaris maydis]|nr:hypothetical protein J3E74DRAFT_404540 [Bipolaris maydis]